MRCLLMNEGRRTAGILLAGAALMWAPAGGAAEGFAVEVIDYDPGVGYATDWATGLGYTLPEAALGAPSRVTYDPDPQWGGVFPVTPFAAPYLRSQLVSLG
ncbi:MAG: hypothetical protein D6766_05820, partial [Verrucomicrobia bacterium]